MAIELKIESYCENCKYFEPIKKDGPRTYDEQNLWSYMGDTYVECKNRYLCKYLEKRIRRELEKEHDESRTETSGERKEES